MMTTQLLTTFSTTLADNDHWDGPGAWWPVIPAAVVPGDRASSSRFVRAVRSPAQPLRRDARPARPGWPSGSPPARSTSRSTATGSPSSKAQAR